jgi:site-specific DNA recombinase
VWDFVSAVLRNPERIRVGMDALIEQRVKGMRGNPEREAKAWLDKIAEVDQERRGYLRLAAKGRMTDEDLDRELAELEETRKTAKRELETLRSRREEVEELRRDRDALLASWSGAVPKDLDDLTSERKNELYRRLRLEITPRGEDCEVKGPFCASEPLSF